MPKTKNRTANDTRFGKGNQMFRGKKARQNMFKEGGANRKEGGRAVGGIAAAGNGGHFKRGGQARGLQHGSTATTDEPDMGKASSGAEKGQARKPRPAHSQRHRRRGKH